jgi:Flp pilus assembly protein TadD
MQDGTPPPDLVRIERICGGRPRPQGYTDAKGHFQFQLDSQVGVDTDAGDSMARTSGNGSRPMSSADLMGCDLRAALPGFVSGTISLGNHTSLDNPDVGIIVLRRAGKVDGTTISMASLNAPKDAVKAYEKGRELLKKEKTEDAERSFQKAVDLYPGYATAWYQLGLLQTHGDPSKAEASFTHAFEADPKFISPYLSLALLCEKNRRWQKALQLSETIIQLNSIDFPQAHFYKAVAQYNLRDSDLAESSVRKAIELDPRHECPQSEKLLGVILADKNDLAGSAEHLHRYLELAPNAYDVSDVRARLAKIESQPVAVKQLYF